MTPRCAADKNKNSIYVVFPQQNFMNTKDSSHSIYFFSDEHYVICNYLCYWLTTSEILRFFTLNKQ